MNTLLSKSGSMVIAALLLAMNAPGVWAQGYLDKDLRDLSQEELRVEYHAWREAGDAVQAHELALLLMAAAERESGRDSTDHARALAEVGITEVLLDRHDEALRDLSQAADLLADRVPLYSETLIAPLTFLGAALQGNGRHEDAVDAFTRAQHITHRLWGNHNAEQIRIVYAKAESVLASGDLYQAEQLVRHAYKLNRIVYGETSDEAIAASARLGTWLRSVGDYSGAISHFHDALSELQGSGPDRPEAYPLLRGMAHAYRGGFRGKHARGMHERVVAVVVENPDSFTLDQRVEAHLDFGDWLMQRYFESRAMTQYLAAWEVARTGGLAGRRWLEALSQPQLIRFGGMAPYDIDGDNQFIQFQFELTADGRPRRVKIADHGTVSRGRHEARKLFPKEVRYRPAIIEGQPIAQAHAVTMYLLPPGTLIEPAPVAAPGRLSGRDPTGIEIGLVDGRQ